MSMPRTSDLVRCLSTTLHTQKRIHTRPHWLHVVVAFLLLPLAASASALPAPTLSQVRQKMAGLAVPFEANQGRFAPEVAFAARTFAGTLFVTRDGRIVHALAGKQQHEKVEKAAVGHSPDDRIRNSPAPRGPGWALVESLHGAGELKPAGSQPSATRVSRFAGDAAPNQSSNIPTFDRVRLGEAWPGVSVELAARGSNVEKLFTVATGTNPRIIRMEVAGADSLRLGHDGSLIAATGNGDVALTRPVAFQKIDAARINVPVRYVLVAGNSYRFETGAYDHSQPLVIDPLLQATYLGGNGDDPATALALDASGNVFVAGVTESTNFPGTTGGVQPSGNGQDAFVARLSSNLTTLVQATYLGGSAFDIATALALDASGNVLVAGFTGSTNFPGTAGGAQSAISGNNQDAFVARLSSNLATLLQATYLGGSGDEYRPALALDSGGNVLVAGTTRSTNFPVTSGGAQSAYGGGVGGDAFVARLSSNLMTLVQATYLGGGSTDEANALTVDASGNVLVAGDTYSTNFPGTSGGAQPANGGFEDVFVARLSSNLGTLLQATYLGGGDGELANALTLDASGNVLVAGSAYSTNFPGTTGGAQPANGGNGDAFVARLSSNLGTLVGATYLGGAGEDRSYGLALDASGNVLVAGSTISTNFPGTSSGAQPANGGGNNNDAFVARLSSNLATLLQATYLGGSNTDFVNALALDASGNVFVAGQTISLNFPGTSGGAQPAIGNPNYLDAFVAKLTANLQGDRIFANGFE